MSGRSATSDEAGYVNQARAAPCGALRRQAGKHPGTAPPRRSGNTR
jgi:hypothetical protein